MDDEASFSGMQAELCILVGAWTMRQGRLTPSSFRLQIHQRKAWRQGQEYYHYRGIGFKRLALNNRTAAIPAELTVEVININDNPPIFDRSNLTVELDEESEQGIYTEWD